MVRECHYVKFTFFSGHIKGENELMGHPILCADFMFILVVVSLAGSVEGPSPLRPHLLRARPKAERVLLRIRENPEYERPAGRPAGRPWSRF